MICVNYTPPSKHSVGRVYVESETFRGLKFEVKDGSLIASHLLNGVFCFDMSIWENLRKEIDAMVSVYKGLKPDAEIIREAMGRSPRKARKRNEKR